MGARISGRQFRNHYRWDDSGICRRAGGRADRQRQSIFNRWLL